eukprot:5063165-Pleurochrysis_carterae.AAC.1
MARSKRRAETSAETPPPPPPPPPPATSTPYLFVHMLSGAVYGVERSISNASSGRSSELSCKLTES